MIILTLITFYYLAMLLYPLSIFATRFARRYFSHAPRKPGRVAVIGSGIAGCGAAWALKRSGWDVTIYERNPVVGGNAKVHTWDFPDKPRSGLSVLAWPQHKFPNYNKLVDELKVEYEPVTLRFFSMDSKGDISAHGLDNEVRQGFAADYEKWARMIAFIARVNVFCCGDDSGSIYNMSYLNPFNIIPLRTTAFMFRISNDFWYKVVEPVYSSTFLSKHLAWIPAVVGPTIAEIVPLDGEPKLVSWKDSSDKVFEKLVEGCTVLTGADVARVLYNESQGTVDIIEGNGTSKTYDNVIYACAPDAALKMMDKPSWLHNALLSNVSYPETETTFEEGIIHNDASVLPEKYRADLLSKYANYIDISYSNGETVIENTFLLSAWVPALQRRKKELNEDPPMMITYNTKKKIANPKGTVTNRHAHPALSFRNLVIGMLIRFLQGQKNSFYCSSFATPGNGHDMSLLSGFAVAQALGAEFPFKSDLRCVSDFDKLCGIMGVYPAQAAEI